MKRTQSKMGRNHTMAFVCESLAKVSWQLGEKERSKRFRDRFRKEAYIFRELGYTFLPLDQRSRGWWNLIDNLLNTRVLEKNQNEARDQPDS